MNRYDLLKEILAEVEAYEKGGNTNADLNLQDFSAWLNAKMQAIPALEAINLIDNSKSTQHSGELGRLVSLLYRYVKIYAKQAIENSSLRNVDEFVYLIIPMVNGAMSKTELINRNMHEKTTGMEIIKRLTKSGFLEQTAAPNDGRSQFVAISMLGRQVLFPLLIEMEKVSKIANGNLTDEELTTLTQLLNKLDAFHSGVLNHEKTVDLDAVLSKYF